MAETVLTKENFESEVMQAAGPVLIDFWATWCGPCQMLAPVVAEIAAETEGKVKVGKVNVDEQPELASAFGVQSIPMLVVLENGQIKNYAVGYREKDEILALLGKERL